MIAIVPARGGSKAIPRKNIRLLNGKPLISYVLELLKQCNGIKQTIVTTDDDEIANYVKQFTKIIIRKRPLELGGDDITLDPVIKDAVLWYEEQFNDKKKVENIVTVQPTAPLLKTKTLQKAINLFLSDNLDCLISAVDNTHLAWVNNNNEYSPTYDVRVNRQWLPKVLKETGAFVICKRTNIEYGTRVTGKIKPFELPHDEAIDIDNDLDWLHCTSILRRMPIDFVVIGNNKYGLGHVRRALTLADYWLGHDIRFICYNTSDSISDIIKGRNYKHVRVNKEKGIIDQIRNGALVINDILDTNKNYIEKLRKNNCCIINFEDLGNGSELVDLVINALYEKSDPLPNQKYGFEFECLDERFLTTKQNDYKSNLETILITFGGTDPSNLSIKALKALLLAEEDFFIKLVIGPAYEHKQELLDFVENNFNKESIEVFTEVTNMANIMKDVDLAITSNGRTIYELAAMKVPVISLAQNDRETMHLFARYSKGVHYLGIGELLKPEDIAKEIKLLTTKPSIRKAMYENLPAQKLRFGLLRVTELIENTYKRWKGAKYNDWQ